MDIQAQAQANAARAAAEEAKAIAEEQATETHNLQTSSSPMIILKPYRMVSLPVGKWWQFKSKHILADKPWGKISIKRADILNLKELTDDNGTIYVEMTISRFAGVERGNDGLITLLRIPGRIEHIRKTMG